MALKTKVLIYLLVVLLLLALGLVFILSGGTVLPSIGTSLFASGIVGLLELVYRRITGEDTTTVEAIIGSGLHAVYEQRSLDEYRSLVQSVSGQLDIAGYSLRSFLESFGQILVDRLGRNRSLRVRMLLVDPKSPNSQARERLENHAPGTFSKSIENVHRTFDEVPNVEIRLLHADLTTMIFRLDRVMFVGPQFVSKSSRATATLELRQTKHAWLFRDYEQEFDAMWNSAVPSRTGEN